jgi:hypothetical protein
VKEAAGLVASRGLARLIRRLPDRLAADKNGRAADSRKDND